MTRRLIATEGVQSEVPDMWLGKNSLRIDAGAKLPVTVGFYDRNIVGWATDLQRDEETGKVTIDVELFEDIPLDPKDLDKDEGQYDFTFYATDVVHEKIAATEDVPEHRLVTDARIRAVSIVPIASLPLRRSHKTHGS